MYKVLFSKFLLIGILLSTSLIAQETFKGLAKQDVNVRSMPDYDSKVAYVLRKNQEVNIEAIIKTKNKGTWYKIENGFVVIRFIKTDALDIPTQTFVPQVTSIINDEAKEKETKIVNTQNAIVQEAPKKVEIAQETVKEESQTTETVVQDMVENTEEELTKDIKPIIDQSDEVTDQSKEFENTATNLNTQVTQEKNYIEPIVIKKEESFISKYINLTYIIYGLVGIIVLIVLFILIGKIFSRPSISDQISQHKRRSEYLKKALTPDEKE